MGRRRRKHTRKNKITGAKVKITASVFALLGMVAVLFLAYNNWHDIDELSGPTVVSSDW